MGFRIPRKTYQMVFADGILEGLEITVEALTLGELRTLQYTEDSDKPFYEREDDELSRFLARVSAWNLEGEDGMTLPIDMESFRQLPADEVRFIVRSWYRRCLGLEVAAPLEKPSQDGEQPPAESIPMETLSPSHES